MNFTFQEVANEAGSIDVLARFVLGADYKQVVATDSDCILGLRHVQAGVCLRNKLLHPQITSPELRVFEGDPLPLSMAISRLDDFRHNTVSDGWVVSDSAINAGLKLMAKYPEAVARLSEALKPAGYPEHLGKTARANLGNAALAPTGLGL